MGDTNTAEAVALKLKEKEEEENQAFDEEEFCNYCCDILKEAMTERKSFDSYIDRWYADWRDIKDKKIIPWVGASNFSVPATSISADGVIPRIIEGNFDTITPIDAKPINKTAVPFKDMVKKFLTWDLDSHEELFREIWFFVQNTVWSGTGFVKTTLRKKN